MPRYPDPELEQKILAAASRLWSHGGEKSLTMRAVAKAAGTTTPTVYERYHDRAGILRALRLKTRRELFAALTGTRTLSQAVLGYLEFALANPHAYEVLFDNVGKPPSLHEPWPSFNLMRQRLSEEIGGRPREHNRLMLAIWCLMHGTAMLIIRGGFEGALRTQTTYACVDTVENIVQTAGKRKSLVDSGPKWPSGLILGEAEQSSLGDNNSRVEEGPTKARKRQR